MLPNHVPPYPNLEKGFNLIGGLAKHIFLYRFLSFLRITCAGKMHEINTNKNIRGLL